mmetsp:Transcript_32602/g.39459  ORF Transcript_32602/g.39459 Transcript_32602/m.39459 type:complete len:296 (-) Transcript_32602:526-1413(-)|eukprot:CAMPEP_0197845940 /NCGR_PEP_ID=MMETSP1438-20131217/2788_1 /TAXON_ID=1461541 /ORGANISM="Pterosperma sp., Strain CCMP1384" /LENGTH=295 /DNA_ID=CAMNT_0043457413 /DNA_START=239 /DNA_END=1126 /DNA_ORIENTATION=+
MQYYTKQQLQGAGRYNPKCRVGNWNEDVEMDEVRLREYIRKKESGELSLDSFSAKMQASLSQVPLATTAKDSENVHIGDVAQLLSRETDTVLSCDLEEKVTRTDGDAYQVTSSGIKHPCARNTFVIEKYNCPDSHGTTFIPQFEDDALHYGQLVTLRSNTGSGEALYLASQIVNLHSFSKVSHNQECYLTPTNEYKCVWKVMPPNSGDREVADGLPVMAGAPVILKHAATGQDLASLGLVHKNDYGNEFEVCVCTTQSNGKQWKLGKDKSGHHAAQHDVAGGLANVFVFITGNLK